MPGAGGRSARHGFWTLVLACAIALLAVGPALARKPVIAYVDATTHALHFYDAEPGQEVRAPALKIPGAKPGFSISFDGRYIAYVDASNHIHLLDRATGRERSLPGIDVYSGAGHKPAGLSVSDTGLIAFDDDSNGPAVLYSSATGSFLATGLPAANGHRQSHLSADGRFLATTCVLGAMKCVRDSATRTDSDAFVQNLAGATDTGFPNDLAPGETAATPKDEEHPCINGSGSLVAVDVNLGATAKHDVFMYNRTTATAVPLPGLNSNADEVNCVLDAAGGFVGFDDNAGHFKLYQRSTGTLTGLPATLTNPIWFSAPYTPPTPGSGHPAPAPVITRFGMLHLRFRIAHRATALSARRRRGAPRGSAFRYTLSEPSRVKIRIDRRLAGRRVGRRCRPATRALRHRARCTRDVQKGTLRRRAHTGANTTAFSGRLAQRALRPGHYRASITATAAGAPRISRARTVNFAIVPG